MFKTVLNYFVVLVITLFLCIPSVLAQEQGALAVAQSVVINESKVEDGDIISSTNTGNYLSKIDYDPSVIGIVAMRPAVSLSFNKLENSYPVISSGNGFVKVNTSNGSIKVGDLITSSKMPGVGMKSTQTGFVIGSALEDYSESDPNKVDTIPVALTFRFAISDKASNLIGKSLSNMLSLSTIAALEKPSDIFKYVLAGFIVLISVVLSVFTFGKNGALGIEALGRNPRASQSITLGIIINVLTSVSIVSVGLGAAYFILVL